MSAGMLGGRAAALGLEDADALLDVLPRRLAAEDGAQALLQRPDVRLEEAGLQLGEERVHAEERVRFAGVEPQAGQLVARTGAWSSEAVAVRLAVVLDRRVEAILHVLQVALERRRRNPEERPQGRKRDRPAILQELVDLVEALESFHASPRLGKTWSVPDFRAEMKGPARRRGLGARLSGRRLAGRLLHPRGRTAASLLEKRPGIPTRCRESHCCCRGGGGPRRLAFNLALCAPKSMLQSAWSLVPGESVCEPKYPGKSWSVPVFP